ncbi:hypothetical protein MLP_13780 [Microlunatus phosphovorus NM-1]|uniref:Uncharacterized protein n=1 Tax=Microlunatus phosphovorus (strain ATCC 700054 / DSM 10555 / JCM 9379 / NBRC 101784 / NCIMB 13414 / VKM Ac-1990 / NM-1) TaxID=1032480 RepID=F5XPT4_MICPN|nr:hypothetical protein MLP_13780 [Microlunatus phosphovorus NM-1]
MRTSGASVGRTIADCSTLEQEINSRNFLVRCRFEARIDAHHEMPGSHDGERHDDEICGRWRDQPRGAAGTPPAAEHRRARGLGRSRADCEWCTAPWDTAA